MAISRACRVMQMLKTLKMFFVFFYSFYPQKIQDLTCDGLQHLKHINTPMPDANPLNAVVWVNSLAPNVLQWLWNTQSKVTVNSQYNEDVFKLSGTNRLKNISIKLSFFAFIYALIPVMEYVCIKPVGIISVSIYPALNIRLSFVSS